MLTSEELAAIRERWIAGRTGNKVLCPERNTCVVGRRTCTECAIDAITPLLDRVEELQERLLEQRGVILMMLIYLDHPEMPSQELRDAIEEALNGPRV